MKLFILVLNLSGFSSNNIDIAIKELHILQYMKLFLKHEVLKSVIFKDVEHC